MRSLPNMSVIETGDATDVESVLELSKNINGPVYIRMIRGEILDFSKKMILQYLIKQENYLRGVI